MERETELKFFVCKVQNPKMKFGYDLRPQVISLDRDRKQVSEFNLFWETSSMFHEIVKKNIHFSTEEIEDLVSKDIPDLEYMVNAGPGDKEKHLSDI